MFSHFSGGTRPPVERKFHVLKREANGFIHKIGVVQCVNKVQADTRARFMYGKFLKQGEAVWCIDPDMNDDDADTDAHQAA